MELCNLFTNRIDYLGLVFKPGYLEDSSHPIDRICCLQRPSNITDLRTFLGPCNVFRRFVLFVAWSAAPLIRKLQIYQPLVYTE